MMTTIDQERLTGIHGDFRRVLFVNGSAETLSRYPAIAEDFWSRHASAVLRTELDAVSSAHGRLKALSEEATAARSALRQAMDCLLTSLASWRDALATILAAAVPPARTHSRMWTEKVRPESDALAQLLAEEDRKLGALLAECVDRATQAFRERVDEPALFGAITDVQAHVEAAAKLRCAALEVLQASHSPVTAHFKLFLDANTPTGERVNRYEGAFMDLALSDESPNAIVEACEKLIDSDYWPEQIYAVGLIGKLALPEGVPLLAKGLTSRFSCVRVESMLALEYVGTPESLRVIESPEGQAALIRMGQISNRDLFWNWSFLGIWGNRADKLQVWDKATSAARTAGQPELPGKESCSEDELIAQLKDPDWRVRCTAATLLGSLHPTLKVIDSLKAMFDDPDFEVQHAALAALESIWTNAADAARGKAAEEAVYGEGFLIFLFQTERPTVSDVLPPTERLKKLAPAAKLAK